MRIAVDVMGGDNAPEAILKGCVAALPDLCADDCLQLVGDESIIAAALREFGVSDSRLEIVHASESIGMDESPVEAVKSKKDSSLVRMALLGSSKSAVAADAVISAGNTGACVSAATMHMRRLPGVHRPGIAVTVPTLRGRIVLCDAGANPEPRPLHLAQYALMAETYAKKALGIERPRIAQLNIGSEAAKGTKMVRQVREMLEVAPGVDYLGYIEARDLFEDAVDIVVTDGFVGNTALKLIEGLAKSLVGALFEELFAYDPSLVESLAPAAQAIASKNDYHEYGGAPLLGVNGVCVISHGSAESKTIRSAIRFARQSAAADMNGAIVRRLAEASEAFARVAHGQHPAAAGAV